MNFRRLISLPVYVAALAAALLAACDDGDTTSDDDRGVEESDAGPGDDAAPFMPPPDAGPGADGGDAAPVGPRVNSVIPNRGAIDGGTRILIVGERFTATTEVHLGGDACTELAFESENHIRCTTPPHPIAEPVHVTVRWAEGGEPSRLDEGFTYFQPLAVAMIDPARASVRGGIDVTIDGRGFIEPTEVRFGNTPATDIRVQNAGRIVARAPAGTPGVVDVKVRNINGEAVLAQAFTYTESLAVSGLEPRWGFTTGDAEVVISGGGLVQDSVVRFGGEAATVVGSELNRERLRVRTPPGDVGVVAVEVENVNGSSRQEDAFLYVDAAEGALSVVGAVPRRVPTVGGAPFLVGGGGFTEATEVTVDGVGAGCELLLPQLLRCTAPPHARGPVEVTITEGDRTLPVPGGLTYYERLELFDVRPGRGAIAGGTVVEVRGRGLTPETQLFLDGEPMSVLEVIDGEMAIAVTPPGHAGLAPLQGISADDATLLPDAYEFFDPVSRFGGVWGDPIGGAVNVTVLDAYTSEPLPESTVLGVPLDGSETLMGLTDANGQVTLSRRALTGPLNVTAARLAYEVYTIERVTTENVTVYLFPQNPPQGNGGGNQEPIPPARLAGTVTGIDKLLKPRDPELILVAFVDTTHSSPFNRRALQRPAPNGILYEDGPFEVFCRPGELAVIVTAAYVRRDALELYSQNRLSYWDLREGVTPLAMGLRRFVSVSPGASAENLVVDIDRPMDLEIPVTLGNPSGGAPGTPNTYEAWTFLDFGAEGYWELDSRAAGDAPQLRVRYLPDITTWDADIEYEWVGEARAESDLGYPYAMAFQRERDIRGGVTIGPFVGAPEPLHPTVGGALEGNRTIEWAVQPGVSGPTEPAQVNLIQISTGRGLPLWTYVTPGPVTRYTLPVLPAEIVPGGLKPDEPMYLTIVPMILQGRFAFEEFTLDDLSFWNRKSYAVTVIEFFE